jgi:hypothetical protein
MKKCPACSEQKKTSEFYKNKRKPDGLQVHCKACHNKMTKTSYERKRPHYLEAKKKANTERRKRYRKLLDEVKSVPCTDCEQRFPPYVMDFDHVRGKKLFHVGNAGQQSLAAVKAEIAKCEVVCSNCHRIRTHQRRVRM